jgi:hypothetical protein
MSIEDTLISKLIEETCNSQADESEQMGPAIDLRSYFEKRLNQVEYNSLMDYLGQNKISFKNLTFQKETGCYQLSWNETVLDFPSNWSIFQNIQTSELIFVDREVDGDFLLDIFAEVTGSFNNIAVTREEGTVNLVLLSEADYSEHSKWMIGYFAKKQESTPNKKAA